MPAPVIQPSETLPAAAAAPGRRPEPFQARFFLALLVLSGLVLGWILWPFWQFLVLSFLLAGVFRPAYLRLAAGPRRGRPPC